MTGPVPRYSIAPVDYHVLQRHYESCFRRHGDSHLGVDWPKAEHVSLRHAMMLDGIAAGSSVLDFGCGLGHLLPAARERGLEYRGVDISPVFIAECRRRFPQYAFDVADILAGAALAPADYVIANGVFTEKRELSRSEMETFFGQCLSRLFAACRKGLRFNVMSAHVDYERPDLFHVPFDRMAELLRQAGCRQFRFRADYGLYEYTVYGTRDPVPTPESDPGWPPAANA